MRLAVASWLLFWIVAPVTGQADEADPFQAAQEHLQKGRYDEALEAFDELARQKTDPVRIAVGRSRALVQQGEYERAIETLKQAVESHPGEADLWAHLAEAQFHRGEYALAEESANRALRIDGEHPRARLARADAFAETGRLKQADEEYRWFVRYYNRKQPSDAETLLLVGRASAQYARWNGVSPIFNFIVNTLCPDALKADEQCWQAYYLSGSLLLEKYNRADALPEFQQALAINPRAAEVLVALGEADLHKHELEEAEQHADQALKVNPHLVSALRLKADLRLAAGNTAEALAFIEQALAVNPHDQGTLARQAVVLALADGLPSEERLARLLDHLDSIERLTLENPSRFEKLLIELARHNPRPGPFLAQLGESLEDQRRFAVAEQLYKAAISLSPQFSEPKAALGMLYMRTGKTDQAREMLDEAFRSDRFHFRVNNMRKVLTLLEDYDTITTEHFVIHFDSKADALLGRYMAEYLEEIYDELVNEYGFEPPGRTHFEVYHDAKGLTAHEWFSARMVGLPWIQTIGASTGMIVALASPTASERPYNWAKVLKHEFVHIITLQQTHFNIPHWFTEALAVTAEGYAPPPEWNQMLLARVPAGDLRTLQNLTDGFVRPRDLADWHFAYCQSRLYAQYMVEEFGRESIRKMLEAYRQGLTTADAIRRSFGVDEPEFEKGYRAYLDRLAARLADQQSPPDRTLAELEQAHRDSPDDPRAAAEYAFGLLQARQRSEARELAEQALSADEKQPLAAIVLATLEVRDENFDSARQHLQHALDRDHPHAQVLLLAAKVELLSGRPEEAAELYRLGHDSFPDDPSWLRGLSAAYSRLNDLEQLAGALEALIALDADDAFVRKRLSRLLLDRRDYARAARFAKMALHIDVRDAEAHRLLAEAHAALKQHTEAAGEFEIALQLQPGDADVEVALARSYRALGRVAEAKSRLEEVLRRDPNHADARQLLEDLE